MKTSQQWERSILETLRVDSADVQPWAREVQRQRAQEFFKSRPQYQCRPSGPQAFEGVKRILQTPALIAVLNPDLTYRQIFLTAAPLRPSRFRPGWAIPWGGGTATRWSWRALVSTTGHG